MRLGRLLRQKVLNKHSLSSATVSVYSTYVLDPFPVVIHHVCRRDDDPHTTCLVEYLLISLSCALVDTDEHTQKNFMCADLVVSWSTCTIWHVMKLTPMYSTSEDTTRPLHSLGLGLYHSKLDVSPLGAVESKQLGPKTEEVRSD